MSDPLSNEEIEDVLSSIRRLVSGDHRPAAAADVARDKLVLTPALRISPDDAEAAAPGETENGAADAAAATASPVDRKEQRFVLQASATLEDTIAELEAAVSRRTHDFEPDGSEREALPAMVFRRRKADKAEESAAVVEKADAGTQDAADSTGLTEGGATAVDLAAISSAEPEPDAAVENDSTPAGPDRAEEIGHTTHDQPAAVDGAGDFDDADLQADHDDTAFDVDEGSFLDEDVLREIVRDVVRQELQGTLGERITRNIRKLVRSEVSRALAARDLE